MPNVIAVNSALADRANGHPVNCVCVDCVAADNAGAVVQQNPAPIGGGVERKEQRNGGSSEASRTRR